MDEALKRAGWIVITAILSSYVTFLVTSAILYPKSPAAVPIVVRDILTSGEHHLYGTIFVQSSCDEVSLKTETIGENKYQLDFTTWQEPAITCITGPTERVFDTIIYAPSVGTEFSATLDKAPVSIAVYPSISY